MYIKETHYFSAVNPKNYRSLDTHKQLLHSKLRKIVTILTLLKCGRGSEIYLLLSRPDSEVTSWPI